MITNGRTQARDEMFQVVKDVLDANSVVATTVWQADLEDVAVDEPLIGVRVQHLEGAQAAITRGNGSVKWDHIGYIMVEIRTPVKPDGLTQSDELTTIVEDAFKGKATPNGVWFRNVVGREVPPKDGNMRSQVTADFTYQETK